MQSTRHSWQRAAVLIALLALTADDGATEHATAFVLRAMAAVAAIMLWPKKPAPMAWRNLVAPLLAMVVVVGGSLASPQPGFALQDVVTVTLVCLVFVSVSLSDRDVWPTVLGGAAAIVAFHALWATAQVLSGARRGAGGFFNPNDLAALAAPVAIAAVIMATARDGSSDRKRRLGWWMLGGAAILALIVSQSRSGALALAAGLLIFALSFIRKSPLRRHVVIATSVLVAVIAALTWSRWAGKYDWAAYARIPIWGRSAQMAWENPLGVGLHNFENAMRQVGIPVDGPVRYPRVARSAHSEPINAWVELGWPGLTAAVLPAVAMARIAWRKRDPRLAATLATFAVPAAVSSSLHVPIVAFFAAAWAGYAVRGDTGAGPSVDVDLSRRVPIYVAAAALLAALPATVSTLALERASVHRSNNDLPAAASSARIAADAAPWSVGAAMMVESIEHLRGRAPLHSIEALIDLAESFPSNPLPLPRAAWLLEGLAEQQGQAKEPQPGAAAELWLTAAEVRAAALKRMPFNAVGWHALAHDQWRAGLYDKAEGNWLRAIELEPNCARALAALARVEHGRGDYAAAKSLAARARAAHHSGRYTHGYSREVLLLDPLSAKLLAKVEGAQ